MTFMQVDITGSFVRRPAWWCVFIVAASACVFCAGRAHADGPGVPDYGEKAVFVRHLATFVEWPVTAFADETTPFVVGVVGDDPFGSTLDEVVANEYVGRRPFLVRRFKRGDDLTECHLLFVSNSEMPHLGYIWKALRNRPVLTVGDSPGFVADGGMVGICRRSDQLALAVNVRALSGVQLKASSKLLEVATVVGKPEAAP